MGERAAEEVRADGHEDGERRAGVVDGRREPIDHGGALVGGAEGPQFLELVDDEQDGPIGLEQAHHAPQPALVRAQDPGSRCRGVGEGSQEGDLELVERPVAGEHPGDHVGVAHPGDHACVRDAALARSRRSDEGDEPGVLQALEHPPRECLASVEVRGVGLAEGAQALVGVRGVVGARCGGRRGRPDREIEGLVLGEDLRLQVTELPARIDPELIGQRPSGVLERPERVRLAAGAVQGQHQRRAEAFAEGMVGDESLELGDQVGVASEGEIGVDAGFDRPHPKLVEAADLVLCELLVGEVGQRRPPPQAQGVAGQCRRLPGIVPERGPGLLHEGLEV